MDANPARLIEFFGNFKQSVIPLFQRPYEWKQREWDIFWKDVLEQYEAEDETSHFMGAIVTMPAKTVPVGVSKYLVIDGQQRLTTVAILMCAIRDSLPDDAKQARNRIQNHYLTNDGYENWEYLKLLPTQLDREAFRALILCTTSVADSNVTAAYKHFRNRLIGRDGNDEPIDATRVLEMIERRLMVVSINLGDADDPYLIFESLNFKGSPLTQADLVRNYYLMRFQVSDQQRVYDELWLPMQKRMGEALTDFMLRYMMMTTAEVVRKGDIYAQLKRRLQSESPQEVEASLRSMSLFSEYYLTFFQPEAEPDPAASRHLARLRRWEVETAHPLLLVLADRRRSGAMVIEDYRRCLAAVESYVVRRSVCSLSTNHLQKVFIDLAGRVAATAVAEWLIGALIDATGARRWPTDEEFREQWLKHEVYTYKQDRCKLLLEALEESFEHKEPSTFLTATIEHVMPQTLTNEWRVMLGESADVDWNRLVNTIGNLTLTGYNSELSNAPFERKKEHYAESHFELNKHFADVEKWDAVAIRARAEALWEHARHIWWCPES